MAIYKCKKCGQAFRYCRGCMVSPILHNEAGYCSKACYVDSKNQKTKEVVQQEDVEVVKTDRDISTSK